jgi:hypothetical protein
MIWSVFMTEVWAKERQKWPLLDPTRLTGHKAPADIENPVPNRIRWYLQ